MGTKRGLLHDSRNGIDQVGLQPGPADNLRNIIDSISHSRRYTPDTGLRCLHILAALSLPICVPDQAKNRQVDYQD